MEQTCAVCIYAKILNDEEHVLCQKRGVVPIHSSCKKQKIDLTKIKVRRKRTISIPEF